MTEHSPLAAFFLALAKTDGWYLTDGGCIRRRGTDGICQCPVTAVIGVRGTSFIGDEIPGVDLDGMSVAADDDCTAVDLRYLRAALLAVCRIEWRND